MIPPTSIDGTDITGATIDGTDVTEITVDGDVVFSATVAFPNFDDFDTNTLGQYEGYDRSVQDISDFSISNSELQQADTNERHFIGYDVSSINISSFFAESVTSNWGDNDGLGLGFVLNGSEIVGANTWEQVNEAYAGEEPFPNDRYSYDVNPDVDVSIGVSFSTPFTQRLEYDGNNIEFFHNGNSLLTKSVNATGSIDLIGILSFANAPGPHWDSFEIGTL